MKIVIYGARGVPAKWSGFDTFITQLAPRLVEKGHTVVAFCQPKYTDAEYHKAYKGVRIIMLPTIYGKFTETVIHEILSSIYSLFMRDIDIMYVLGCRTVWAYLPHKLLGRTIVINTDGQDGVRRKWGPISRLYLRFNYWLARQMSDYLISDAKELKNYYLEHHNKETAFLTNGGFIVEDLDEGILAEYDLIQNGYYLVACRMEPENNIDIIIREFEQTDVDAKLVIAGGANYKSRYYQSLKQTSDPRIVFLGPVYTSNHIETLHLHARGYLHGHEVGGTNPSLLKAMGCGNVILVNGVKFNVEVLGGTGYLWDKSVNSLKQLLTEVDGDISARQEKARVECRERILKFYTWDKVGVDHDTYFKWVRGEVESYNDSF